MTRYALGCGLLLCSHLAGAQASLGVALSDGGFLLNRSPVRGNATLLEGTEVESLQVAARLQLANGARVRLEPGARAKVHQDRIVIEQGNSEVLLPPGYPFEARALRFAPQGGNAEARVSLAEQDQVHVGASAGLLRVTSMAGILVSRMEAGMALAFTPQPPGQAPLSSFIGCLLKRGDDYFVFDSLTRIEVLLRGSNLEREWGNRVQVNGTARQAPQGAAADVQLLDVTSITRIEAGGCAETAQQLKALVPAGQAPAAAPRPAAAPQPAPAGGGMSAGTKVAIVAVLAGGGGAAAYVATQTSRSK